MHTLRGGKRSCVSFPLSLSPPSPAISSVGEAQPKTGARRRGGPLTPPLSNPAACLPTMVGHACRATSLLACAYIVV